MFSWGPKDSFRPPLFFFELVARQAQASKRGVVLHACSPGTIPPDGRFAKPPPNPIGISSNAARSVWKTWFVKAQRGILSTAGLNIHPQAAQGGGQHARGPGRRSCMPAENLIL